MLSKYQPDALDDSMENDDRLVTPSHLKSEVTKKEKEP